MAAKLKAPYPAFGGKAKVAPLVWQRLGNVENYIEPFCNSAAVLLQRPSAPAIETINDWDCYVSNFWRSIKYAAAKVAEHADNPVNEADLHARHRYLVLSEDAAEFRQKMRTEPEYFDVRIAGWWVWGSCCWIGSGWCAERAINSDGSLWQCKPLLSQRLPALASHVGTDGKGVHDSRKFRMENRPQLADAYARGRGVNANDDAGTCAERLAWITAWLRRLQDRLRTVRVCCGDWIRVCDSPSTTTRLGLTGVFLDPPYKTHTEDGKSNRTHGIYASDRDTDFNALVDRVIKYCSERGSNEQMRIAVCCYEGEGYEVLADKGWTVEAWKASGGYGNQSGKVNENASRERIWFSPHCKPPEQPLLFKELELTEAAYALAV